LGLGQMSVYDANKWQRNWEKTKVGERGNKPSLFRDLLQCL
jgi:hypothetical protein